MPEGQKRVEDVATARQPRWGSLHEKRRAMTSHHTLPHSHWEGHGRWSTSSTFDSRLDDLEEHDLEDTQLDWVGWTLDNNMTTSVVVVAAHSYTNTDVALNDNRQPA
ncbi:unnamed protein product [Cyclocybe aegerita]|uniref:Uncharacterized protein n=1 Tax=Cyclocybe aegerita TaxID=1973307 RepID=A0A8S0WFW9_CYCAE|nr:unnamed protein product [Cyclocybe aegerita]